MSKVSIIVPVYNKSSYIANTLESILNQSFSEYEVIIVNDGSTDDSLEIVKEYAKNDKRFIIIDIPNGGVSKARNVGLEHANGEWIQFLDGDDLIDKDYLRESVNIAEKMNVDIVFTNFWMVNIEGIRQRAVEIQMQGITNQEGLCRCFMQYQYQNGFFGYISNKLFSRTLLKTSGAKFPLGVKLAEDLDFYAHLYREVKSAYFMPITSFYYMQTDENYLNNIDIDYISQLKVHLDIREWFEQSHLYNAYKYDLDRKISDYVYFSMFYTYEERNDLREAYQKIISDNVVVSCVSPEYYTGFERNILQAVKENNYMKLCMLLNSRYCIRTLYRRLRKNG